MFCLKYLLRVQRKLTPITLALGLVTPAVAHEPQLQSTVRHPVVSTQLPGGPHLLSTVLHVHGSKIQQVGRPSALPGIPSRLPVRNPRYSIAKPMTFGGILRSDVAAEAANAAPAVPAPVPAPEPAPAPQPENPNPTPPAPAPVPSLDITAAATAAPQVPEVQPVAPGTETPAAGVELPW